MPEPERSRPASSAPETGAALVHGRFLGRRARTAQASAAVNVEVSLRRISTVVLHATALANRLESVPVARDLASRRERQERVRRLRAAAAAGQERLQRAGRSSSERDPGREGHPAAGS